jgi:hypothetical protein
MSAWRQGVVIVSLFSLSAWAEPATDFADDFTADKWAAWQAADAVVAFAHNPALGNQAPGALQITVGPDNPRRAGSCFLRHFEVKPGQTYTALVYVSGKDLAPDSEVTLGFQGQDAERHFLGTGVQSAVLRGETVPVAAWRRMVLSFRVPDTGKWEKAAVLLCTLGVANAASGQVFFDDFEFFQAED